MRISPIAFAFTTLTLLFTISPNASAIAEGAKRTESCWTKSGCKDTYADTNGTRSRDVAQDGSGYRAIQWIGTAVQCENTSYCYQDLKKESTGTVTWQFGVNLEFQAGVKDVAAFKAAGTASRTTTQTDKDTIDFGKITLRKGQSAVQYTYVQRKPYTLIYTGAWRRTLEWYNCGLKYCYDYYWTQDYFVMSMDYDKAMEEFQTLTYKVYTTSQGSGLRKE